VPRFKDENIYEFTPMKSLHRLFAGCVVAGFLGVAFAADPVVLMSASDLASRLSAQRENGSTDVRLRMEVQQPRGTKKETFQIQIKERRAPAEADVAYVVLWPKERKGEAFLVRQKAEAAPEAWHLPVGGKSPEEIAMSDAVFGSDLAVADMIENFFAWKDQKFVGKEVVDRVDCQILESKPGSGDVSIYGRVRSWVDTRRMVPLRIEKYLPSGKLARRIETTRVVAQGSHGNLPANMTVSVPGKNSLTGLDGSRIRYDVTFSDREFTPEGLRESLPSQPAAK
jgi:hypothetical protein